MTPDLQYIEHTLGWDCTTRDQYREEVEIWYANTRMNANLVHAYTDGRRAAVHWHLRVDLAGPIPGLAGEEHIGKSVEFDGVTLITIDASGLMTRIEDFWGPYDAAQQLADAP